MYALVGEFRVSWIFSTVKSLIYENLYATSKKVFDHILENLKQKNKEGVRPFFFLPAAAF